MSEPKQEPWRLDRKVPLALIGVLFVQSMGLAWFASNGSTRLDAVEKQVLAYAPQAERLIRVETKTETILASVAEIKDILRRPLPTK
jgi:hypothetical protein